ncbi:MAG: cytochrome c [Thermoanaerobaculia bacterium]
MLVDDAYIRESILMPTAKIVQGYEPLMPSFQGQLSDETLNQLVAYVKSLSTTQSAANETAAQGIAR